MVLWTVSKKFGVWFTPSNRFLTILNTQTDKTSVCTNPNRRSRPYLLHMKARDENLSKPKLSRPKETRNRERNRDGSPVIKERENRLFSEGSCESESRGEMEGLKPAHAAWNHLMLLRSCPPTRTATAQALVALKTWSVKSVPFSITDLVCRTGCP